MHPEVNDQQEEECNGYSNGQTSVTAITTKGGVRPNIATNS